MKTALLILVAITMVSCSNPTNGPSTTMDASPSLKVSVLNDGSILNDGKPTTIAELDLALAAMKKTGGTVWYYREAGQAEPPPQAMEVIKLVAGKSLPITLSSKPDFSDYIGEDGQSHPRKK